MDTSTLITLIGLFIFLLGSGITSSMETAFTSVNRIKLKQRAEKGDEKAKLIEKMLEQPSSFLGTALLLNNLCNIASASVATALALKLKVPYAEAIATGMMTFLILVFGEITPKTFAVQSADKLAYLLAPSMNLLQTALKPIVRFFILVANGFLKIFGAQARKEGPFITEEEIMTLVSVGEEEGIIEKQEKELINSIFEFGDTIVKEVMVPRMDMLAVDKNADLNIVFELIQKEGVSRVPVYDKTIDNVIGIVYARDLLIMSAKNKNALKTIQPLIKRAYYVPETKRVIELLTELQKVKVHMAIVVDEYGGTAGLVTIEDLLEEIVGEIFDEYDSEEVLIEKIDKDNYRVNAKTDLDEINKQLNLDLPDAEYESIGGFVVSIFGKIPTPGEKIDYDSAVFTVEKVIRRRLSKILITKKEIAVKKNEH